MSIKQTFKLLAGMGAIMVCVHAAALLFSHCSLSQACLASVYFGVPSGEMTTLNYTLSDTAVSTLAFSPGTDVSAVTWSDVHAIVQVVGIYALLLGVIGLLLLELKEIKLLKQLRNYRRQTR